MALFMIGVFKIDKRHLRRTQSALTRISNFPRCVLRNEFQAFAALVLNSVTESIVRLKVLKFSAAAFIALTVSWLLTRALTMFSVISFDLYKFICVLRCHRKIHVTRQLKPYSEWYSLLRLHSPVVN